MDFNFIAATMGSVVGEKLTRLIERCTDAGVAVVIVSASGGAHVRGGYSADANGEDLRGVVPACGEAVAVYFSDDASDYGRGEREFRDGGRHQSCGT
jgi:acetyl-CoA carboxylase carboxyl transferase subunit beta